MLSDEEKQTIDYLKARLYGNEGCKFIDVAQSDLRIFLKLVENLQKDIESWKKYCNEQENDITLKNNKICDLEFKIEKQFKEIEELKEGFKIQEHNYQVAMEEIEQSWEDKTKAKIEELQDDIKYSANPLSIDNSKFGIKVLQSLLEKEEIYEKHKS